MALKTLESTNYQLTFLHGEPKQSKQNLFYLEWTTFRQNSKNRWTTFFKIRSVLKKRNILTQSWKPMINRNGKPLNYNKFKRNIILFNVSTWVPSLLLLAQKSLNITLKNKINFGWVALSAIYGLFTSNKKNSSQP